MRVSKAKKLIIPEVEITPATDIKKAIHRADLYCIKTGENCADIPCEECLFDACTWNNEKEKQLLNWEKSQKGSK